MDFGHSATSLELSHILSLVLLDHHLIPQRVLHSHTLVTIQFFHPGILDPQEALVFIYTFSSIDYYRFLHHITSH